MEKMVESCVNCVVLRSCYRNEFKRCVKIEVAAEGLGVPSKPKEDESYITNVPFGVYMGLKHIMAKHNKELERINKLKQGIRSIALNEYAIDIMGGERS